MTETTPSPYLLKPLRTLDQALQEIATRSVCRMSLSHSLLSARGGDRDQSVYNDH
jgi:hypothetical protein